VVADPRTDIDALASTPAHHHVVAVR
jgi:hypothetical protein